MSNPTNDPFFDAYSRPFPRDDVPPGHSVGHSDRTEFTLVKRVLRAAGGGPAEERLLVSAARAAGLAWPTCVWLDAHVSGLPVRFGYGQVPFQADVMEHLTSRFTKTPCFTAWAAVADLDEDDERPVACSFRWPGWGDLVIHDRPDDLPDVGTCIVHYQARRRFVIEPLAGFLPRLDLPPAATWELWV